MQLVRAEQKEMSNAGRHLHKTCGENKDARTQLLFLLFVLMGIGTHKGFLMGSNRVGCMMGDKSVFIY